MTRKHSHTGKLSVPTCSAKFPSSPAVIDSKWFQVFYGGVPVAEHKRILKSECPHIIVGTPGRVLQLVREKELQTKGIKHFILDECDKMLEQLDMRRDVQEIFKATPHEKQAWIPTSLALVRICATVLRSCTPHMQVMMFSATLSDDMRVVCKKFMQVCTLSSSCQC